MLQCDWIIENSFSKVSRLFSQIAQSMLRVLLHKYSTSAITCFVMKTKNIQLKKYSTLLLNIRRSQMHVYQNKWLHRHTVIMMYYCFHYIWKQPLQIKHSDQFRVNKRDTDCSEHLHEENTEPLLNVSVLHA